MYVGPFIWLAIWWEYSPNIQPALLKHDFYNSYSEDLTFTTYVFYLQISFNIFKGFVGGFCGIMDLYGVVHI